MGLGSVIAAATTRPRVALLLPTGTGFVIGFYGILAAGKSVVPVNFLMGPREIAHVFADSGVDCVVTGGAFKEKFGPMLTQAGLRILDIGEVAASVPATAPSEKPASAEACLMYTSGTSGLPKGVVQTHGNWHGCIDANITHAELKEEYVFFGVLPLFHSTGMAATMLAPISLGSTAVYHPRFSAVAVAKVIEKYNVGVMAAVPSMYAAMLRLKSATAEGFSSIYAALSGGEPLTAAVREGFEQRFGKPILEGYGLTETCGPLCFNSPAKARAGSVGQAVPGTAVRIEGDDGQKLGTGQTGELLLAGPMVCPSYWNLPEETAKAFGNIGEKHFFRSGDLGHIDADGYVFITGRKKDLIIVAGEKVYPREVEELIATMPGVAEVAVMGKKDPSRGEVVVAFVAATHGVEITATAVREFCTAKGLVNWKTPREVYLETELPKNPTGKVLKRELAKKLETL